MQAMLKHCFTALLLAVSGLAFAQTHPAPALSATDFSGQIEDFLRDRLASYPGEPRILVTPPQIDRMPACQQSEIFLPSQGRLRPRMSVGMRCLAPAPWVSYTQAEVGVEGIYYVASHSLDSGTVVTLADVAPRNGDLLRLAAGTIYDTERLLGSITTQRIGTGSPLRERNVRSADSIARGQAVRLEARGTGFVASSDGTALQGGEPGTQIQVRSASGQTVSGIVVNGHTVMVRL